MAELPSLARLTLHSAARQTPRASLPSGGRPGQSPLGQRARSKAQAKPSLRPVQPWGPALKAPATSEQPLPAALPAVCPSPARPQPVCCHRVRVHASALKPLGLAMRFCLVTFLPFPLLNFFLSFDPCSGLFRQTFPDPADATGSLTTCFLSWCLSYAAGV